MEPLLVHERPSYALRARNAKTQWKGEWYNLPNESDRQVQALRSGSLFPACEGYERASDQDLNHFYSGLNAAAMLTIVVELVQAQRPVWEERFETTARADAELADLQQRRGEQLCTVQRALKAEKARLERRGGKDIWLEISGADLLCLTTKHLARVAQAYREALVDARDFHRDAAGGQLAIYERLGILADNARAALAVVGSWGKLPEKKAYPRVLLFTGHQIDSPSRRAPRFPTDKVEIARQAIRAAVKEEQKLAAGEPVIGMAGGASGGDILFHEVCAGKDIGIPTELYLALPPDQYAAESVAPAGPPWVEHFHRLCDKLPTRVLQPSPELPRWLRKPGYGIWQRNNLWLLHNALAKGSTNVTLIALWDGRGGDGPGGTEDMVRQTRQRGAKDVILDSQALFGV